MTQLSLFGNKSIDELMEKVKVFTNWAINLKWEKTILPKTGDLLLVVYDNFAKDKVDGKEEKIIFCDIYFEKVKDGYVIKHIENITNALIDIYCLEQVNTLIEILTDMRDKTIYLND